MLSGPAVKMMLGSLGIDPDAIMAQLSMAANGINTRITNMENTQNLILQSNMRIEQMLRSLSSETVPAGEGATCATGYAQLPVTGGDNFSAHDMAEQPNLA